MIMMTKAFKTIFPGTSLGGRAWRGQAVASGSGQSVSPAQPAGLSCGIIVVASVFWWFRNSNITGELCAQA